MRLRKLSMRNIRSYKEGDIEFPDGSLLLTGDVGAGKTSVLLAIEYALFGLQPGQKGDLLLRNDSRTGEVSLEVEINEKLVIIERRLRRSGKGVSNDSAAIIVDGVRKEASITEIKTKIFELIGYPFEFIKKSC